MCDVISCYLLIIFTNGIIAYIREENPHIQAVERQIILALLPADDLAKVPFTINGLLGALDQRKYCNHWNVKCNLNKTKITVLRKGKRKLKYRKRAVDVLSKTVVVKNVLIFGVKLGSSGDWRQKKKV
jgi:hypothetical protein